MGPPPYTQLSGETKALPNMDAFLFSWICGALPWGFCTPSSPPSLPLHTHRRSISSPVQEGWKIPGAVHCVLFHWWKWHSDRMEVNAAAAAEGPAFEGIECKNNAKLKAKVRILTIDWWKEAAMFLIFQIKFTNVWMTVCGCVCRDFKNPSHTHTTAVMTIASLFLTKSSLNSTPWAL